MTHLVDTGRRVQRADDGESFVTRRIAGETIIVPISGNVGDLESVYTLNDVGSFIWQLIDGDRTAQALAAAVCAEYDVGPEQAARDVAELLDTLESRGLVRPSGGPRRDA
jgi:hypothetical protein